MDIALCHQRGVIRTQPGRAGGLRSVNHRPAPAATLQVGAAWGKVMPQVRAAIRVFVVMLLACAAFTVCADQPYEYIYGAELMTHAQRERYRQQLQAANPQQAQQLRAEHQARIQARAKNRCERLTEAGVCVPKQTRTQLRQRQQP
jgi:hypothetical protein